METDGSLVQDARPMLGENIAIFGQGLIGLSVTALLSDHPCGGGTAATVRTSFVRHSRSEWEYAGLRYGGGRDYPISLFYSEARTYMELVE